MSLEQDYSANGFIVLKDCIDGNAIKHFLADFQQLLRHQEGLRCTTAMPADIAEIYQSMQYLFHLDQTTYLNTLRTAAKLLSLQQLFLQPKLLEQVNKLGLTLPVMQTHPVFHVMAKELSIRNGYFGFSAHQDWSSIQSSLDLLTVWMPFTNVCAQQYTLEVVPGSHQRGLIHGELHNDVYQIDQHAIPDSAFIPLSLKPGDVVFMSGFTVHRSCLKGEGLRLAASYRFENAACENFIKRGYQLKHHASIDREIDYFPIASSV